MEGGDQPPTSNLQPPTSELVTVTFVGSGSIDRLEFLSAYKTLFPLGSPQEAHRVFDVYEKV